MMEKPTCPECEEQDIDKSEYRVTEGMSTRTLVQPGSPYWNEDGEYIVPDDPNTTTTQYSCSNGHTWKESHD